MISPVRSRAKASGLTRMSVRSTDKLESPPLRSGGRRLLGGLLRGALTSTAGGASHGCRRRSDLDLTGRAQLPRRVEWPTAGLARILELAHAVRAAQIVLLDLEIAVRTQVIAQLREARLGRLHLELTFPDVVQIFGRPDDHVDDRPDER